MNLTFADLLTPQGVVAFAAVVTSLVALLRNVFTKLTVSGALQAFVFTGIGYVLCAFATNASTLDALLLVFLAWLACATSAVGIHSTVTHARTSGS